MRLSAILPIAIFVALAGVFGFYLMQVGSGAKDVRAVPSVLIDKPAPALDLPPIVGRSDGLRSADLEGRVSLVNVFASWCPPCRAEHPLLMHLIQGGYERFRT